MTHRRVLVIEDEYLIALDIESMLAAAGIQEVRSASTEMAALREVGEGDWDAVVADANLNDAGIDRIAAALFERSIPFVIVTGYSRESLPAEVQAVPVVAKPFLAPELIETIMRIMA
jgi:CheY-like chemotaxis protein